MKAADYCADIAAKLAMGPTEGVWRYWACKVDSSISPPMYDYAQFASGDEHVFRAPLRYLSVEDANYIAACHPAALRSILEEREQNRAAREQGAMAVAKMAEEVERLRQQLAEAHAWKARVIEAAEEAHGPSAIRFKLSLFQNGRARNHFPSHLDQRWVSFVYAEDDAHIGYIAKALEATQPMGDPK